MDGGGGGGVIITGGGGVAPAPGLEDESSPPQEATQKLSIEIPARSLTLLKVIILYLTYSQDRF